jgi:signal transduction histidine kinase
MTTQRQRRPQVNHPIRLRSVISTLTAVILLLAAGVRAHNGKVALASPLGDEQGSGITIDGDLSDWPDGLVEYRLANVDDGMPLDGPEDLAAYYRVGYHAAENAIYVAVNVQDNSVVRGVRGRGRHDTQDGCEVYLEPRHRTHDTRPIQYQQWGEQRGIYGPGDLSDYASAVRWREDGYDFEYRLDLGRILDQDLRPLSTETVLGFDVAIWEKDVDGSRSWVNWGRQNGKYLHSSRLGDLAIVPEGVAVQDVLGRRADILEAQIYDAQRKMREIFGYQMFFTGLLAAVTLLHVLLFLFDPTSRINLYYALFTGAVAAGIFTGLQLVEFQQDIDAMVADQARVIALCVIGLLGVRFLHELHEDPPQGFFRLLVTLVISFLAVFALSATQGSFGWLYSIVSTFLWVLANTIGLYTIFVILRSIRQKREGAWIFGIGFALFSWNISSLIDQEYVDITLLYWVLLPLVAMSVYLARKISHTNRDLAQQLRHVEDLSAQTHLANEALQQANEDLRLKTAELDLSNRGLREQAEELRLANEEVMQANKAKSAFLANMSHEIRTPMNGILSFTALIRQGKVGEISDDLRDVLGEISSNGDQLLALINDILDLSKIEAGAMTLHRTDCAPDICIENAIRAVEYKATEKGLVLTSDVAEDLPVIQADERRLTQHVLLNLLRNAIKFTAAGTVRVGCHLNGSGEIVFEVADSGIGIAPDEQERIFESFHQVDGSDTRAAEGTGLGLAIARRFVEMHGGRIWVDSESGQGATFRFTIPITPVDTEDGVGNQ